MNRILISIFTTFIAVSSYAQGTYNTSLLFDFDKDVLRESAKNELDEILKLVNTNPDCCIELSGHTDYIGSNTYNQYLSERRVNAVIQYLLAKGVKPENILNAACGEVKPCTNRTDDSGRQMNRRVELKLKFIKTLTQL